MATKVPSGILKRRKTNSSFFYAERLNALDPALLRPTPPLEQENNILSVENIGKQYQLTVKDYNIQVRDNRIRAKDDRIAELEEENETSVVALSEMQRQRDSLKEHVHCQQVLSEDQASQIKTLISMMTDNRGELMARVDEIKVLKSELEAQRARVKELEDQGILDRVLEWMCGLLGLEIILRHSEPNAFPFMQLPGELRHNIYKKCLVSQRPIDFWPLIPDDVPHGTTRASILKQNLKNINVHLLCTSRQVHSETVGILYGCNRFRFSDVGAWTVLEGFLLNLNRNCRYLRSITVHCPDWFYTLYDEEHPLEIDREQAGREMQPVLDRFGLTIDNPIGPSLHPVSAFGRASEMMLRLTGLKNFTLVVEYNVQLYPFSADHLSKILTDEDRMLYPGEKPNSHPKRTVIFLRRPESRPRIQFHQDLDNDDFMGRRNLSKKASERGVIINYGTYGSWADRVSYVVDDEDEEEEEYDVEVPGHVDCRGPWLLHRALRKLLGY